MKMRLTTQYFNMVEITLALAILGIGIASIMVLFPVGIGANRSAIADNNVADVAEYLLGYVQKQVSDDFDNGRNMANSSSLIGKLSTSVHTADVSNFSSTPLSNLQVDADHGVFRYDQKSVVNNESVVDFAAEARLWSPDEFSVAYRDWTAATAPWKDGKIKKADNYERLVYLEVSWPADAPYKVGTSFPRDKRLFIIDSFDPNTSWTPGVGQLYNGVF